MNNKFMLVASICIFVVFLIGSFIVLAKIQKGKNANIATNITQMTTLPLLEPHPSLKNQYSFDLKVFYSGSSKNTHVIMDRSSPVFKIDMSTGSIILKYSRMPLNNTITNECSKKELESSIESRKYDMVIETPSIPFQTKNKIVIKQDLRYIDIYLNGEQFHSAVLDFVPYLDPSPALLLPYGAHKLIEIKHFSFKTSSV